MKPTLMSVTAEYVQAPDENDGTGNNQGLTLTMEHCGARPYLVLETTRWAFDLPEDLFCLVRTFVARVEPLFEEDE